MPATILNLSGTSSTNDGQGTKGSLATTALTAHAIVNASKAELQFWIKEINIAAKKKVLNTSGKNNQTLCERLANYYSIDLSPDAIQQELQARERAIDGKGIKTRDREIHEQQWAWLRTLAMEWRQKLTAGQNFVLIEGLNDTTVTIGSTANSTGKFFNSTTSLHHSPGSGIAWYTAKTTSTVILGHHCSPLQVASQRRLEIAPRWQIPSLSPHGHRPISSFRRLRPLDCPRGIPQHCQFSSV